MIRGSGLYSGTTLYSALFTANKTKKVSTYILVHLCSNAYWSTVQIYIIYSIFVRHLLSWVLEEWPLEHGLDWIRLDWIRLRLILIMHSRMNYLNSCEFESSHHSIMCTHRIAFIFYPSFLSFQKLKYLTTGSITLQLQHCSSY